MSCLLLGMFFNAISLCYVVNSDIAAYSVISDASSDFPLEISLRILLKSFTILNSGKFLE